MSGPKRITQTEYEIVQLLREEKPYEQILIMKSRVGKIAKYAIKRDVTTTLLEPDEQLIVETVLIEAN